MIRRFVSDHRGRLVEDALTLPVLLLVAVALVNFTLYGMAAAVAQNAANYAARMGAVAQRNSAAVAESAAWQKIHAVHIGADFQVTVQAADRRGSVVVVKVTYRVRNYYAGLAAMLGVHSPAYLVGHAEGRFRHEGW